MKQYYFNDGTSQQGPFTIEELKGKNITSETPVWYDGLPDWTTAGQLEDLKDIFVHTPPPFHPPTTTPVEEVKPVTPVAATPVAATTVTVTETPAKAATTMAATAPTKSAKKSTAWLSYVLALLVFGGVGYFIYQDMEKNKGNKNSTTNMTLATDSTGNTTMQQPTTEQPTSTMASADDTAKTESTTTTTTEPATITPATTTTTTPTTTQPATVTTTKPIATKPTPAELKAKQIEVQKLAQKKAEEEKKKLQAAQAALAAAAAKEKDYRNNWPRYITFGKLDYNTKGDGIDAFNVPVYNGTNAMLDKVTVRVDYMKKDKKVVKSETIFIYNIPSLAGLNGKAPESKKGNNVKVFITGITSRKLHFCYPTNNGNPADPYFCN
jgi:chemotaxis protein histidine kinase CheA